MRKWCTNLHSQFNINFDPSLFQTWLEVDRSIWYPNIPHSPANKYLLSVWVHILFQPCKTHFAAPPLLAIRPSDLVKHIMLVRQIKSVGCKWGSAAHASQMLQIFPESHTGHYCQPPVSLTIQWSVEVKLHFTCELSHLLAGNWWSSPRNIENMLLLRNAHKMLEVQILRTFTLSTKMGKTFRYLIFKILGKFDFFIVILFVGKTPHWGHTVIEMSTLYILHSTTPLELHYAVYILNKEQDRRTRETS